jgi:hypothetical protein
MQKWCPSCGLMGEGANFQRLNQYESGVDASILNTSFDKDLRLHVHQAEPYVAVFSCFNCDCRFVHFYKDPCPIDKCGFNDSEVCRGGICKLLKSGD